MQKMPTETSNRRIVITGAAGRIGTLLRARLGHSPGVEFVLLDRESDGQAGILPADLSRNDADWTGLFAGVDAILHLAADPRPTAPWWSISENNITATLNVFRAAVAHKVRRVVYASSLQTMEGYRYGRGPITPEMSPRPTNWYGVSKLMGESMAKFFTEDHGLSTVCLRIGRPQTDGARPRKTPPYWERTKILITEDLCQGVEKAVFATQIEFAVLPLVSDNPGMRWDLSETRRLLGYSPTPTEPLGSPALTTRLRAALSWAHKRVLNPAWQHYWD
jgi:hypothetical protein